MKRIVILVATLTMSHALAQQVEISVPQPVTVRLDWQAIPGRTYSVHSTPSLLPSTWTNATPFCLTPSNVLGTFESILSQQTQFYRIVQEDTDPPTVAALFPGDDAIAVASNAQVVVYLDDQTGIDTSTISLTIGAWTNLTLTDSMLIWSNQMLTFNPTSVLGEAEAVISNSLTVADTLGRTLSNFTWTFQLDHPTVATNAFIPLVAPPPGKGPQVLSVGGMQRVRSIPGIAPLSGEDEFYIITVTSNTVVFSYTNTPPSIPAGTHLVSFDAAFPFYRDAISNTVDAGEREITVWTTNIPLTDLISEGVLVSSEFVAGQPLGNQFAAQGAGNLLHVEFGDDLSGKILYEDSALKLHLLNGSYWGFVGDVDVALDIAFDLWTLSAELRSLDASAGGTLTLSISPEAIFNHAVSDDGSTPLVPPVTHIFGAMAGPIPVWVEVVMELNAGYEYTASVAGNAHTTVFAEKGVTFYVRLRQNEWTHGVENPPIVLEADPITWQLEGEANVVVYIQPKLTVLVYSLAGLWADIKPYAEFDGWYQATPLEYQQAIYLGLSSTLGIESRIWYDGWGSKPEWELFDWKEMIWSDSHPNDTAPTFISAFPNRSVAVGNRLILSGYADGTPDPGYSWYYNGSKIVGESSPEYEIASANSGYAGTYSIKAHNSAGNAQTSCVVTVTNGSSVSEELHHDDDLANGKATLINQGDTYSGNERLAVRFTAPYDCRLTTARMRLWAESSGTPVQTYVVGDTGGSPDFAKVLATKQITTLCAGCSGYGKWHDVDFDDVGFATGDVFYLVCTWSAGQDWGSFQVSYDTTAPDDMTLISVDSGSSWFSPFFDMDAMFRATVVGNQ